MHFGNITLKGGIKLVHLADIIINDMNITRNDVVLVHTSLSTVKLIDSQPEDLIYLLKMIVGTEGALLMPTVSVSNLNPLPVYDIRGKLLGNDNIYELFRQMPDTIQSRNPSDSFAAWGGMAKKITEDHFSSGYETDTNDLLYKLSLSKAKIIGIGIPLKDFSFLHAMGHTFDNDSMDEQMYSAQHLYNISHIIKSKSYEELSGFFKEGELKAFEKKGIPFFVINAEKIYNKAVEMSKSGATG